MSTYTLEDIKNLLENGDFKELNYIINSMRSEDRQITKEDVEILEYLSNSDLISEDSKYVLDKLKDEIIDKIEDKEETEIVTTAEPVVETSEVPSESGGNSSNDSEVIETEEPVIDNGVSVAIVDEAPVVEEEENTNDLVNENDNQPVIEGEEPIENSNDTTVQYDKYIGEKKDNTIEYSNYSEYFNKFLALGLTIKDFSNKDGVPRISFEINNFSKSYLDNLMLQLYDNPKNGLGFDMTKLGTTKEELFTIYMNDPSQSLEDVEKKTSDLLDKIENIVVSTKNDKDYEEMMPDNLKNLKEQFTNDAPDIPLDENYRIGYLNSNGTDNFYLMAGSKNQAIRLTEEMGFEPRKYLGNGVVEIEDNGKNLEGTKLEGASVDINNMDTNQAYTPLVEEKAKQKTLGTYPAVKPNSDNGFSDLKTVILVILLIIAVMIIVFFMQ